MWVCVRECSFTTASIYIIMVTSVYNFIFSFGGIKCLFICYTIMIVFLKTWHNVIANPPFAVFDSTEELLPLKTQCSLLYSNVNTGGLYCREKDVQLIKTAKLCVLIWSKIIWIFIFDLLESVGTKEYIKMQIPTRVKTRMFCMKCKISYLDTEILAFQIP